MRLWVFDVKVEFFGEWFAFYEHFKWRRHVLILTMSSLIAILTFNRHKVLERLMNGLVNHTPLEHTIAIFDDCSTKDNTPEWLSSQPNALHKPTPGVMDFASKIEATHHFKKFGAHDVHVFIGTNNLGVAGNSNRAIAMFELLKDHDHLFLLNDDLVFTGDATSTYSKAHRDLDIGLFCFNNLPGEAYRFSVINIRGWKVKIFERMTGAIMSITRPLFNRIGYFDTRFPKMENEHCDYTNRARLYNFMNVLGKPQACIDIMTDEVDHQHDCEPTISGLTRQEWNRESMSLMAQKIVEYQRGRFYEPFTLRSVPYSGCHAGFDKGTPTSKMPGVEQSRSLIVPFD